MPGTYFCHGHDLDKVICYSEDDPGILQTGLEKAGFGTKVLRVERDGEEVICQYIAVYKLPEKRRKLWTRNT